MKQEQLIESILLRQSGELDAAQTAELQAALDHDPNAAALARDYDTIYRTACEQRSDEAVSELTLQRILQYGETAQQEAPAVSHATKPTPRPIGLSLAAVLALLLSITAAVHFSKGPTTNAQWAQQGDPLPELKIEVAALENEIVDEEIETLNEELYYVSEELFGDDFWGDETVAEATGLSDIEAIAAELLELEEQI